MSDTIENLTSKLQQATQEAKERDEILAEALSRRELVWHERRLATLDRTADVQRVQDARRAFADAVAATPGLAALAELHAAQWIQYRNAIDAHTSRVALAVARGQQPPHDPGASEPGPLFPDALIGAIANRAVQILEEHVEIRQESYRSEVLVAPDDVPAKEIAQAKSALESKRRAAQEQQVKAERKAAEPAGGWSAEATRVQVNQSIDVTDMSEAQRAELGLPPGMPSAEAKRRARAGRWTLGS